MPGLTKTESLIRDQLKEELRDILNEMNIPTKRKLLTVANLRWLQRNIWFANHKSPQIDRADKIIDSLLSSEVLKKTIKDARSQKVILVLEQFEAQELLKSLRAKSHYNFDLIHPGSVGTVSRVAERLNQLLLRP